MNVTRASLYLQVARTLQQALPHVPMSTCPQSGFTHACAADAQHNATMSAIRREV
jgi:hypothetical protein